jgi:hypothetical protein
MEGTQDIAVGIVTELQGARETDWVCIPGRGNKLLFSRVPRPAPKPTKSPVPWVQRAFSPRVKQPKLDTDPSSRIIPRSTREATHLILVFMASY